MYVSLSLSFFVWKFKHLHVAVLLFESGLCFGILLCDLVFNGCCRHILLWADATTCLKTSVISNLNSSLDARRSGSSSTPSDSCFCEHDLLTRTCAYGVATTCRLLKIIGLFCRI